MPNPNPNPTPNPSPNLTLILTLTLTLILTLTPTLPRGQITWGPPHMIKDTYHTYSHVCAATKVQRLAPATSPL